MTSLNELEAELRTAGRRIGTQAAQVVRAAALQVEAQAKQFAPVDTGNLKASIGHDLREAIWSGTVEAVIGPTASYGKFVEEGTSRMPPQAFLGPALDRVGPDFMAAVEGLSNPFS